MMGQHCTRIYERYGECYTRSEFVSLPGGLPRSMWCAACKARVGSAKKATKAKRARSTRRSAAPK